MQRAGIDVVGLTSRRPRTGKTTLVPLTNSLYVPGKLADTDHVIVDIGTGYYVKKVRSHSAPPQDAELTRLSYTDPCTGHYALQEQG